MCTQQRIDEVAEAVSQQAAAFVAGLLPADALLGERGQHRFDTRVLRADRKSTRLNSSHLVISYAVFCLKKKTQEQLPHVRSLLIVYRLPLYRPQQTGAPVATGKTAP